MRKLVVVIAATLLLCAQSTNASVFTFDPDGAGVVAPVNNANTFDWLPGNALSIGSTAAIGAGGGIANPFQTLYQAKLGSVLNSASGIINLPGLNSAYEYTIVASIPEFVSLVAGPVSVFGLASGASFAAFDTLGRVGLIPNYIEIYTSAVNSSSLLGTGFNDGILVLSGSVTSGTSNFIAADINGNGSFVEVFDQFGGPTGTGAFPGYTTLEGTGSTSIAATVSYVNAAYFPGYTGTGLNLQFFNTSQVDPFQQQAPSLKFSVASGAAPIDIGANPANRTTGLVNGTPTGGGKDFQFQADGNSTLNITQVVPEPTSIAIWAVAGACVYLRRRHRSA